MRHTLTEAFDSIEATMVRNIANSLFQLEFHTEATPEELVAYYGWEEAFEEEERQKLIADTRTRLASEQLILSTYKKMELTLKDKYGTKEASGDLGLPVQRAAGSSDQQGSVDTHPEEAASDAGPDREDGHGDDAASADHGSESAG